MQPKNFKDMIFAELTASNDYMKKAIDSMKSYPKWSSIFKTMSDDRFYHAEILYKMFIEVYINTKDQDNYLNSLRDAIVEEFSNKTRLIDSFRATYDLINGSSEPLVEEEKENERNNTN